MALLFLAPFLADSAFVDDDGFLLRGARNAFDLASPELTTPVYEMYYRRVGD